MRKKEFKTNKASKILSRFLVFVIIILCSLIVLKGSPNLRNAVFKNVFQNNLKFAKINELYEKYFGSSLPLTGSNSLALVSSEKLNYEKEEKYKDGVKLTVSDNYAVPLLESGIVIFTGEKEGYGNTVIVQGADDVEVWYSNLKEVKVSMYDYLKKGSIVGETMEDKLVLVFTKDGKNLDYKKYI
ncbi:MAG: M23 family metallopeptidase [Bacilli bacterium]|nr:M23 family metallopeptidase [Bacilli bacterium]